MRLKQNFNFKSHVLNDLSVISRLNDFKACRSITGYVDRAEQKKNCFDNNENSVEIFPSIKL